MIVGAVDIIEKPLTRLVSRFEDGSMAVWVLVLAGGESVRLSGLLLWPWLDESIGVSAVHERDLKGASRTVLRLVCGAMLPLVAVREVLYSTRDDLSDMSVVQAWRLGDHDVVVWRDIEAGEQLLVLGCVLETVLGVLEGVSEGLVEGCKGNENRDDIINVGEGRRPDGSDCWRRVGIVRHFFVSMDCGLICCDFLSCRIRCCSGVFGGKGRDTYTGARRIAHVY